MFVDSCNTSTSSHNPTASSQFNLTKLPAKDERNEHYFDGNKGNSHNGGRNRNKFGNNSVPNENHHDNPTTIEQQKSDFPMSKEKDSVKIQLGMPSFKDGNMKMIDDDDPENNSW